MPYIPCTLVRTEDEQAAKLRLVVDLDQRRDWLDLFPFLSTRRPEAYGPLTQTGP